MTINSLSPHIPVMLSEVIENLDIAQNETYIDCTFGAGGYSEAILSSDNCILYAIDQDPNVIPYADKLKKKFNNNFKFVIDNFANLQEIANLNNITNVAGIVFDLGVSSMQLDVAERGFSFNKDARLDMRMSANGIDAWQVINTYSEEDLADIIYYYGEERNSRKIARKIVQDRQINPINTTIELANLIHSCVKKHGKLDPATKTFQAIRIFVNDELKNLKKALYSAYNLLKIGGKIVIVSFQGLEDRIIKDFIKNLPANKSKVIKPEYSEIRTNIRSRSAKLRTITKTSHELITENVL